MSEAVRPAWVVMAVVATHLLLQRQPQPMHAPRHARCPAQHLQQQCHMPIVSCAVPSKLYVVLHTHMT
jgi:hypothetical protein